MTSTASIALSGMQAAQAHLDSSAHNIANLSTANFKREEVQQATTFGGGTQTSRSTAAEAGPAIETDVVQQLQAKNAFLANLAVFKTSQQMTGALLDMQS